MPQQYARPVQQPVNTAQQPLNAQQQSAFVRPQQTAGNAGTQPAQGAWQTPVNPYARPASQLYMVNDESGSIAQTAREEQKKTANPYARPIAPVSQQTAPTSAQPAAENTQPQRRTRMQRYHDAGGESQE